MTFVYDRIARNAVDKERGFLVKYGGGGGPSEHERQDFHLVHKDWEFLKVTYIIEKGIHNEWTDRRDDRGLLIVNRTFDEGARAVIQYTSGKFVRGETAWTSELEEILKQGIYCQYTGEGKQDLPVHFTIPDGSDLPPPFDPNKSAV